MNPTTLTKQIDRIVSNDAGEADFSAYLEEILTRRHFGLDLDASKIVVDSRIDDSRRRSDLVAYKTVNGKAQRGPDYAHAVFEVKLGDRIADDAKAVSRKKALLRPDRHQVVLPDRPMGHGSGRLRRSGRH